MFCLCFAYLVRVDNYDTKTWNYADKISMEEKGIQRQIGDLPASFSCIVLSIRDRIEFDGTNLSNESI